MLGQFWYSQIADIKPQVNFQQDGAPRHWSLDVRNSLTESFQDCWIGRDGSICRPPRSPDMTPLDFFLWAYIKDRVFANPVQDLHDLRTRILDTIARVTNGHVGQKIARNRIQTWYFSCYQWCTCRGVLVCVCVRACARVYVLACACQWKFFEFLFRSMQSHSYIRRGNRRMSLAALPGLSAASRGVKLPLLANSRSVF